MQGSCSDTNCMYAHGEGDLRVTQGIYKTQICNFYERGYCKKGERCNHAHGKEDVRAMAPTAKNGQAHTPTGNTSVGGRQDRGADLSGSRAGRATQKSSGRSPLPLAELLVDAEGNPNSASAAAPEPTPSPSKSTVAEHLHMWASPLPNSPPPHMWGQYMMHGLSPGADTPAMVWPREPIDVLRDHGIHPMNLSNPQSGTPYAGLPLSHCVPLSPFASPYGLEPPYEPQPMDLQVPGGDSVVQDLNERLASLDAVVRGLASDVAGLGVAPVSDAGATGTGTARRLLLSEAAASPASKQELAATAATAAMVTPPAAAATTATTTSGAATTYRI